MGRGERQGQADVWAGLQAGIFKVRLGLGETEIERYREIETHRDRADNKNPEQSRVAQLVENKTIR